MDRRIVMAGIDYETLILNKDGHVCNGLNIDGYIVTGYKYNLCFTKGKKDIWLHSPMDAVRLFGNDNVTVHSLDGGKIASNIRKHRTEYLCTLMKNYDIVSRRAGKAVPFGKVINSTYERRTAFIPESFIYGEDCEEHFLVIAHIGDDVMYWFPNSPAEGGATYAYFLAPDDSISLIATGYGHNDNPMLHWMNRGLGKEIEEKMAGIFYEEMTYPTSFNFLMINFNYWFEDGEIHFSIGNEEITDSDISRIWSVLGMIKEKRIQEHP